MESQALSPEGNFRPREAAKATKSKPAGINRNEDTKKGPVLGKTSFIATIAVPQKKKGDTNTAHSHTTPPNITCDFSSTSSGTNFFEFGVFSNSSDSDETTHSTSSPVPTQSTSDDESICLSESEALKTLNCLSLVVLLMLRYGIFGETLNLELV